MTGTELTVCGWIKMVNQTGEQFIFTQRNGGFQYAFSFCMVGDQLQFRDYAGGEGFASTQYASTTIDDTNWHHVAFTKSGTAGVYYIDGVPCGTPTAAQNISYTTLSCSIGWQRRDVDSWFNGTIDDLAIFDRALTSTEISNLYNGTIGSFSPSLSPSVSPSVSKSPSISPSCLRRSRKTLIKQRIYQHERLS